ncbi:MAG TPA: toll/interleukin-1 receptor domain-containing protein [Gemmatimonadaceae bacterium]|jgi:hypothetical protein
MLTIRDMGKVNVIDLFLCHTGADKDWVRMLGSRLEQLRIGDRAIRVFFDEWDVDFGENIISKIHAGLKQSRYVGLVLSPRMIHADWPTAEWQSQVMADPIGRRGKILPLLRHKFDPETGDPIDMPFALASLKRFDFTRDRDFERELERLARKLADLPPQRGPKRSALGSSIPLVPAGQESPDVGDEALPSNLLLCGDLPESLYSDDTAATTKRDVWDAMKGKQVPPFVLYENRLVSFVPPAAQDNPFRAFSSGTKPRVEPAKSWMANSDQKRQLVGLLNAALREHCYHLGIFSPKDDRSRFFCPIFGDGKPREFRWSSGSSVGRSRSLSKMKARLDKTEFGVHMSADMRFMSIGDRLFLLIEPGWLFTTDGITPLQGREVGRFSTLWGGKERNAAVLRNVLMWGLLIANGRRDISLNLSTSREPRSLVIQPVPLHSKINRGIVGDSIRLDLILGGEGAGEVRSNIAGDAGGTDRELDDVADLALLGSLAAPDGEATDGIGLEERVEQTKDTDGLSGEEEDSELPF